MPTIDADFRRRMDLFQPKELVLLCSHEGCKGGAGALARHGYPGRTVLRRKLTAGSLSLWIELYRLARTST
jgi:hypothetical protein